MSDSSPSCENNTSDTGSQVSSTPSDLPAKRRCRSNSQIQGKAWVFQGEITTYMLSADTESVANTPNDDDDEEDDKAKFSRLKLRLTARLGDDFINFRPYLHISSSSATLSGSYITCLVLILTLIPQLHQKLKFESGDSCSVLKLSQSPHFENVSPTLLILFLASGIVVLVA